MSCGLARNSLCKGLVRAAATERLSDNLAEHNEQFTLQGLVPWEFLVTPFCDKFVEIVILLYIFLWCTQFFMLVPKQGQASSNRRSCPRLCTHHGHINFCQRTSNSKKHQKQPTGATMANTAYQTSFQQARLLRTTLLTSASTQQFTSYPAPTTLQYVRAI